MPDTIAPAPGPLVAELLVDGLVALDVEALTAAFTARGLTDGGPFLPNGWDFTRRMRDGGVRIEMRDEPVPGGDLVKPLGQRENPTNPGLGNHIEKWLLGVVELLPDPGGVCAARPQDIPRS